MQTKLGLLSLIITLSALVLAEKDEAVSTEKGQTTVRNKEAADGEEVKRWTRHTTNGDRNGDEEEDIEEGEGLIGRWRNDGRALEPKWRDGDNVPLVPFSHYSRGRPGDVVIKSGKEDRLAHLRLKERGGRQWVKSAVIEDKEEAAKARIVTRQRSRGRFDFGKFDIDGTAGYREAFQARNNEYDQELNDEEYLKPRPRKRRPPQHYEFVLAASEASSRKAESAENAKNYQSTRPWNSKSGPEVSNTGKVDGNRFDKAIELKSLLKMQQEEGLSLSEVLQRKNLTLHDLLNGKPDVITALKSKDAGDLEEVMEQASRAMSNSLKKLLVTDLPRQSTAGQPKMYGVENAGENVENGKSRGQESKFVPTTAMTLLSTAIVGIELTQSVNAERTLMSDKDGNDTVYEEMANDTVRYVLYSEMTEPSRDVKAIRTDSSTTEAPHSSSSPPLITSTGNFRASDSNGSGEMNARRENSDEDEIMEFSDFRDYPKPKMAEPSVVEIEEESTSGYVDAAKERPESGSTLSIEQILSPTSRTTFQTVHRIETTRENDPTDSNVFPEYVDDTPQRVENDDDGYSSEELEDMRTMMNALKPKERGSYVNEAVNEAVNEGVKTAAAKTADENDQSSTSPSAIAYEGATSKADAAQENSEGEQQVEPIDSFDSEQKDTHITFYSYEDQRDEPPTNTLMYNYEEQSDEPAKTGTTLQSDQPASSTPPEEELPANHRTSPKVSRYEDIISEIEPEARAEIFELFASGSSAKRLERILKSRNMSLDELIALRQRGSSKVHLAEVSKIRQETPRILEETVTRVQQIVSREEMKKGKDAPQKREDPEESSTAKEVITEILPTFATFASLPFEENGDERKVSLKDLLQIRMPDNYDVYLNAESSSTVTEFQGQTTTGQHQTTKPKTEHSSSLRTTDLLPKFASRPLDKGILTKLDDEIATSTEKLDDSGNLIHGYVEQIAKDEGSKGDDIRNSSEPDGSDLDETRKVLSKVRPSIIASGAILGVTIVVFLGILIVCRLRQKQKYTYRNTFSRAVFQGPMMAARKLSNSSSLSTVMVNVVATSTAKRPERPERHERHGPPNPDDFGPTSDIDNDSLDANDSWETIPDYMK